MIVQTLEPVPFRRNYLKGRNRLYFESVEHDSAVRRFRLIASCSSAVVVAIMLCACATGGPDLTPTLGPDAVVERGRVFAEQRCSGCHAITLDESPGASGPRFRDIQRRHNGLSLERRLAEITQHGHFEMPPVAFSAQQARDVAAYIESLGDP